MPLTAVSTVAVCLMSSQISVADTLQRAGDSGVHLGREPPSSSTLAVVTPLNGGMMTSPAAAPPETPSTLCANAEGDSASPSSSISIMSLPPSERTVIEDIDALSLTSTRISPYTPPANGGAIPDRPPGFSETRGALMTIRNSAAVFPPADSVMSNSTGANPNKRAAAFSPSMYMSAVPPIPSHIRNSLCPGFKAGKSARRRYSILLSGRNPFATVATSAGTRTDTHSPPLNLASQDPARLAPRAFPRAPPGFNSDNSSSLGGGTVHSRAAASAAAGTSATGSHGAANHEAAAASAAIAVIAAFIKT